MALNRFSCNGIAIVYGLACCSIAVCADELETPLQSHLKTIVVTGTKPAVTVPDEELRTQVETAMRSDPYFYDEHIVVTIKDGVVTLQGIVFDEWDMRAAKRISKRIAGVKRVVNELELISGGD